MHSQQRLDCVYNVDVEAGRRPASTGKNRVSVYKTIILR